MPDDETFRYLYTPGIGLPRTHKYICRILSSGRLSELSVFSPVSFSERNSNLGQAGNAHMSSNFLHSPKNSISTRPLFPTLMATDISQIRLCITAIRCSYLENCNQKTEKSFPFQFRAGSIVVALLLLAFPLHLFVSET